MTCLTWSRFSTKSQFSSRLINFICINSIQLIGMVLWEQPLLQQSAVHNYNANIRHISNNIEKQNDNKVLTLKINTFPEVFFHVLQCQVLPLATVWNNIWGLLTTHRLSTQSTHQTSVDQVRCCTRLRWTHAAGSVMIPRPDWKGKHSIYRWTLLTAVKGKAWGV